MFTFAQALSTLSQNNGIVLAPLLGSAKFKTNKNAGRERELRAIRAYQAPIHMLVYG